MKSKGRTSSILRNRILLICLGFCLLLAIGIRRGHQLPEPKTVGWVFADSDGVVLTLDADEKEWHGSLRVPGQVTALSFECIQGADQTISASVSNWNRLTGIEEAVGRFTGRINESSSHFEGIWRPAAGQNAIEWNLPAVARRHSMHFTRGFMIGTFGHKIEFKATYPAFIAATPLTLEINQHIRNSIEAAGESVGEDIADSLWDSLRYPGASWAWNQVIDVELVSIWPDIASLRTENYQYTGGAHGNSGSVPETWVLTEGRVRKTTLPELLPSKYPLAERLGELDKRDLMKQGASSVSSNSPWPLDPRHLSEFTVTREGIELYHPPYEAGSYAEGEYVVRVRWADLGTELQPDHPLAAALIRERAPKKAK